MLYKLWNKRTLYEIYFRPLPDKSTIGGPDILSKVELITYFSGEPYVNPRTKMTEIGKGNTEVWDVDEAREAWDSWINTDGYEVSEVEDYLKHDTRIRASGGSINYLKSKDTMGGLSKAVNDA